MHDSFEDNLRRVLTQRADTVETTLTAAAIRRPVVRRRMAIPVAIAAATGVLTGAGAALAAPAVFDDQFAHAPALSRSLPIGGGVSTEGFFFTLKPCPAGWTPPAKAVVDPNHPNVPIGVVHLNLPEGNCMYLARPGDMTDPGH